MTISLMKHLGTDGDISVLAWTRKNWVAETCMVKECTVRSWRRSGNYPNWARILVSVKGGYLNFNGWNGWKIDNGKLYSPHLRDGFTPSEIETIHYLRQRCDHLERINAAPAQYYLI